MNATTHIPSGRILPAVWKLLLLRLRINWNSFRHAKLGRKIGTVVLVLLVLGFAGFLLFLSWLLLWALRSPQVSKYTGMDAGPLIEAVPALLMTGMFVGILLTSFGVLLQALYLSGDMDFLLATPVPIRAVFVSKLLQAVLPNFTLIAFFGLPLLFGLGLASGYNFLYYPLVLLVMAVMSLAAAGLSSLLVMLVARIFPPRRIAEVLAFFGAIIGFTCGQSGNLYRSFAPDTADVSSAQTGQLVTLLMNARTPWLPLNWAGQGLVAIGQGHWPEGILLVTLTLGLAALAFGFALVTAERWYYSGWAGMQVVAQKKTVRTVPVKKENGLSFWARLLPAPIRAIINKDFLLLRRDLRNMAQLVTSLIFGVMYSLMMFRGGSQFSAGSSEIPAWLTESFRLMTAFSSVGMAMFAGWMLLSRLAGLGFSMEGKNYWLMKVSPVRTRQLLSAKFLVAYLPSLALGLFFLVGIGILQKMTFGIFLYALAAMVMCLAGMTGIQLTFGVAGANFTWDDPRKMNAGGMGCLGQVLTILYMPVAFGLFVLPVGLMDLLRLPPLVGYLAGLVLGTGLALTCVFVPLLLVRRRVERLGEG